LKINNHDQLTPGIGSIFNAEKQIHQFNLDPDDQFRRYTVKLIIEIIPASREKGSIVA